MEAETETLPPLEMEFPRLQGLTPVYVCVSENALHFQQGDNTVSLNRTEASTFVAFIELVCRMQTMKSSATKAPPMLPLPFISSHQFRQQVLAKMDALSIDMRRIKSDLGSLPRPHCAAADAE